MSKPDPMIGRVLHGSIEIKRLIGRGGMGNVYEALQTNLDRRVAVKVMTPEHAANPMAADYFIREAKQASKLRHPNVIQIIDFGKEGNDILFIAMEFVPGQPLSSIMREASPLPTARVVEIMAQTMEGLAEAHSHHLIHRDLKPDNLMIEKTREGGDFVKILDFGISQSKAGGAEVGPLTQAGALVGTPQYMSPEQAKGESVDARSDLFSMGVILYEILTGTKPFSGNHVPQILMEVIQKVPTPPAKARPDLLIDPELEMVCIRALNKNPDLRYQSAMEFKNALRRIGVVREAEAKPAAAAAAFIFKRGRNSGEDNKSLVASPAASAPVPAVKPTPAVQPSIDSAEHVPGPLHTPGEDGIHTVGLDRITPSPQVGTEVSHQKQRVPEPVRFNDQHADPSMPFAGTEILHGSGEVVDSSKLFSLMNATPAPIPVPAPVRSAAGPLGLDLQQLRADLVGEKRSATVLVVHHRTRQAMNSEELSEHLTVYASILQQVAERWGGMLQARQGAYATLAFGIVKTSTDDSFRTAQAALDLRAQLRRMMPREFAFGFGIAQGEVFMPGGQIERASGHVIDHASDASRDAGDDEILLSGAELQEQLDATFKLAAPLKNGLRPVLGVLDVARQPSARVSNLIGRDEELATGLSALARISRGQGALFAVLGHAGMGKTALLHEVEAFAEQRGHLVLRTRASLPGIEGIRDAVLGWLRDLARIHGRARDLEIMFRELGLPAEPTRLLAAFMRNALGEVFAAKGTARSMDSSTSAMAAVDIAFRALLKKIQETRPVLLTLDQIDDYDDAFASWYSRWARGLSDVRVMWLLGIRTRSSHTHRDLPPDSTLVYVDALDDAATRMWLKAELPQDVSNALRSELATLSGGIPLQIRQLVDHIKRHKITSRESAEDWLSRAREVNAVLQMRFNDLSGPEKNLLALLSVLGNGTPGEVLLDLAHESWKPETAIQNLFVEGVLEITGAEDDPILNFKPSVLERVVRDQLSKAVQKQIHGRAVDYYQARLVRSLDASKRQAVELPLVRHLIALERRDEAVQILDQMADACLVSFDYELADVHLARIIQILTESSAGSEDIARRSLKRVRVQAALGNIRIARDICRTIDRLPGLPEILSLEIKIEQAYIWLKEEDPDTFEPAVKRAVGGMRQIVQSESSVFNVALLVRGMQLLGEIYERKNRLAPAIEVLIEAVAFIEQYGLTPTNNPWGPRLLWEPVNQLGRLRLRNGEPQGAASLFDVALKVAQEAGDQRGELVVRANQASLQVEQRLMDAALRSINQALKLALNINDLQAQSKVLFNLGLLQMRQSRKDLAEESFARSLALAEQLDWREGIAMATTQLSTLRSQQSQDFMKPRG